MEKINRKEIELKKVLSEPFVTGETVEVPGNVLRVTSNYHPVKCVIQSIDGENVIVKDTEYRYEKLHDLKLSQLSKVTQNVGYNPMIRQAYRMDTVAYSLESIVHTTGFDRYSKRYVEIKDKVGKVEIPELNWNPYVFNSDGSKTYYQRDFCWTLEEKQALIESIYNNISLGRVIVREHSYRWIEKQVELGNTEVAFKDIVDGKQRLNCILSFLQDEFPDSHGYYYSEFSEQSTWQFLDHQLLGYAVLNENSTDKDTIDCFLRTNFAGVPMSQEHILFVKSIKL